MVKSSKEMEMNLFKHFAKWLDGRKRRNEGVRKFKERYAELERKIVAPQSFEDILTPEEHEEYLLLDWLKDHDYIIHLQDIDRITWKEGGD
jgi:hypothetical protein